MYVFIVQIQHKFFEILFYIYEIKVYYVLLRFNYFLLKKKNKMLKLVKQFKKKNFFFNYL